MPRDPPVAAAGQGRASPPPARDTAALAAAGRPHAVLGSSQIYPHLNIASQANNLRPQRPSAQHQALGSTAI